MRHEVTFQVPKRVLGKSDIQFLVKADGDVFGELRVSKGAIVWYSKKSPRGSVVPWGKLDNVIETLNLRSEKRKNSR